MEEKYDKLNKSCNTLILKKDINNKILENHYIIDRYLYTFKKELKNGRISLRCVNR